VEEAVVSELVDYFEKEKILAWNPRQTLRPLRHVQRARFYVINSFSEQN